MKQLFAIVTGIVALTFSCVGLCEQLLALKFVQLLHKVAVLGQITSLGRLDPSERFKIVSSYWLRYVVISG